MLLLLSRGRRTPRGFLEHSEFADYAGTHFPKAGLLGCLLRYAVRAGHRAGCGDSRASRRATPSLPRWRAAVAVVEQSHPLSRESGSDGALSEARTLRRRASSWRFRVRR